MLAGSGLDDGPLLVEGDTLTASGGVRLSAVRGGATREVAAAVSVTGAPAATAVTCVLRPVDPAVDGLSLVALSD